MKEQKIYSKGRLTIPKEFREELKIGKWEKMELTIEYGRICIKPYSCSDITQLPYVGIVRMMTEQNRIIIPKEYLEVCGIEENEAVLLSLSGEKIEVIPRDS